MTGLKIRTKTYIRKYDKSHAEIIWRVREFFEEEKRLRKRIDVDKVIERTIAATGASKWTVIKLKSPEDVEMWDHQPAETVQVLKNSAVPEPLICVVRKVIRDMFLEKKQQPTLDTIFANILNLKVKDVEHLNLFHGVEIPESKSKIWYWS